MEEKAWLGPVLPDVEISRAGLMHLGCGHHGPFLRRPGAFGLDDAADRLDIVISICREMLMAQLVVRKLEDDVKARLQRRARRHGRSTEEEVREILRNAVRDDREPREPLGSRIRARFAGIGLDDELPELRGAPARPETFEK
jgi:plasmid stability protein